MPTEFKRPLNVLLMLLIVGLYFGLLVHYSVNVPNWDDYDAVLGSNGLIPMLQASDLKTFLHYLFMQHDEHRIMTSRLVMLAQYHLTGHVNFTGYIVIASLFRVGTFLLIYFSTRNRPYPLLCLMAVFFFQLSDWEGAFWGMAALSAYMVIFFVFLSLFLLHKSMLCQKRGTRYSLFALACFASFLATFSNGNGMFVFLPGLLMLAWNRAYYRGLIYFIVGALCVGFYFDGYHAWLDPTYELKLITYLFLFFGNLAHHFRASFCLGLIATLIAFFYMWKSFKENALKSSLFFYYLLFIGMSALADAINRLSMFGLQEALESHYVIYSILLLSILLAWSVERGRKVGVILGTLIIAVAVANTIYGISCEKAKAAVLMNYHMQANGELTGLYYPDQAGGNAILKTAAAMGVYSLPNLKY